jgi:hypothetical protein
LGFLAIVGAVWKMLSVLAVLLVSIIGFDWPISVVSALNVLILRFQVFGALVCRGRITIFFIGALVCRVSRPHGSDLERKGKGRRMIHTVLWSFPPPLSITPHISLLPRRERAVVNKPLNEQISVPPHKGC